MNKSVWPPRLFVLAITLVAGTSLASAHDPTASVCKVRLKPDVLELQIKIAAEAIWPQVQDTTAPGQIFVMEDFERVGKGILETFARTMEEMTINGASVGPKDVNAAVVEDNFIFTLTYPRPTQGVARLKETYLLRMPPDYVSRDMLLDQHDEGLVVKTLQTPDILFEMKLPPREPPKK